MKSNKKEKVNNIPRGLDFWVGHLPWEAHLIFPQKLLNIFAQSIHIGIILGPFRLAEGTPSSCVLENLHPNPYGQAPPDLKKVYCPSRSVGFCT